MVEEIKEKLVKISKRNANNQTEIVAVHEIIPILMQILNVLGNFEGEEEDNTQGVFIDFSIARKLLDYLESKIKEGDNFAAGVTIALYASIDGITIEESAQKIVHLLPKEEENQEEG